MPRYLVAMALVILAAASFVIPYASAASEDARLIRAGVEGAGTQPASQQRIFRNTRGQIGYYAFYRATVSSVDRCYYAYSTLATQWTTNVAIGLDANYVSCSVVFREDSASSRSIVYVVASKMAAQIGTERDIVFLIGTISDSAVSISFGTVQTVRASSSVQNQAYPVSATAADGYLHVAFDLTQNDAGTANDFSNVVICSTTTTVSSFGVNNPSWNCSDPNSAEPFKSPNGNALAPEFVPHVLSRVSGHDIMTIAGQCYFGGNLVCQETANVNEYYRLMDWDGSARTWGSRITKPFSSCTLLNAELRSAVVNSTSGVIYHAWNNETGIYSRTFAPPYTANDFTKDIKITSLDGPCSTPFDRGVHLTINMGFGGTPSRVYAFYTTAGTTIFSRNTTLAKAWGSAQVEYTNATVNTWYPSSPYEVNPSSATYKFPTSPLIWLNEAAPAELWFSAHFLEDGVLGPGG